MGLSFDFLSLVCYVEPLEVASNHFIAIWIATARATTGSTSVVEVALIQLDEAAAVILCDPPTVDSRTFKMPIHPIPTL